jgi:hypothetical protein
VWVVITVEKPMGNFSSHLESKQLDNAEWWNKSPQLSPAFLLLAHLATNEI